MACRRATLIVDVDRDDADRVQLEQWLARWEPELAHCSDNLGCGCCVDIFEVEAPAEALAELPERFFGGSDWSDPPRPDVSTPEAPSLAARLRNLLHARKK